MRIAAIQFAALALLGACASPQENCVFEATQNIRVLDQLIEQTEANVARGFAVSSQQDLVEDRTFCPGEDSNGNKVLIRCTEVEVRDRLVPVAINIDEERAKLAALRRDRADRAAGLGARIAECEVRFPQ